MGFLEKLFGTYSDRELKKVEPIAKSVMALEDDMAKLSDAELKAKTPEFKERLKNGETLDDLLPEAFAVMREASWRVLGMKHFYVQVIGGVILHQGRIAEMKTGEGKTLVSTLPAYLNALTGKGVHIVTVNDYLAQRDSEWMGKVYRFLGMSCGLIIHEKDNDQRREAYACDITYGTNNELGFDYLRDNMVVRKEQMVQRGHNYAIVDEVDSILIDEARTPLIISGMGENANDLYKVADMFAKRLKKLVLTEHDDKTLDVDVDADYIVDEKAKTATLTERGVKKAEQGFGVDNLSDPENMKLLHHINQALHANGVMHRDQQYVVKDGEVLIVDEFTGRIMPGRRYSDGLHQAIEAKEGVKVEAESRTLATITFQNFFRLYQKLSGMTGTALTEEEEFQHIYKLDCVAVPTNKPVIRVDEHDQVYKTENGKFTAVINQIKECHEKGQPVLVGTVNVDKSEKLSSLLKREGIRHEVLNAKYHEKEAEIVAQAGKKGAVTIATNMAGRGTDIMLGGNAEYMAKHEMAKQGIDDELIAEATGFADTDDEDIIAARKMFQDYLSKFKAQIQPEQDEVRQLGGLYIIGTERHESRRIDNQLRGRSGRQGDPGTSRFFLSLDDDLMRIFGSERVKKMVEALGLEEDQPIEAKMLSNAIENAQKNLESRNFDSRKHVLQYDEVMNEQRKIIYKQRQMVLDGEDMKATILSMIDAVVDSAIEDYIGISDVPENWNLTALKEFANTVLAADGDFDVPKEDFDTVTKEDIREKLIEIGKKRHAEQEEVFGDRMREVERVIVLQVVDTKWM
ncbi:MAG: preprotein translocase subunit SecA, partial [Clostridiales bacterium]|nr:preprotein translocase subunit SecA [Clostridiales bacterium]